MKKRLFDKIGYINLYSKKYPQLINFYKNLVGVPAMKGQKTSGSWYGFDTTGVKFALEPITNRKNYTFKYNDNNPILMQFIAKDEKELEAMNKRLEKKGIKLLARSKETRYGKITNFLDPDKNVVEILLQNTKIN